MAPTKRSSRGDGVANSRARRRKHEHAHVVLKVQGQRTTHQLERHKHRIVELAMETLEPLRELRLKKDVTPGKELFEWMRSLEIQVWFHKHRRQSERSIRRVWEEESGGLPFPQPTPNMQFPSTKFMQEGIKLISDIFFFGALRRCSFTWKAGLRAREGPFGRAREPLSNSPNWQDIEIDPKDGHEDDGTPDHVTSVIDTLLHECIHAFLSIYSCHNSIEETEAPRRRRNKRSRNCKEASCPVKKCQDQWKRAFGPTGHGTAWLSIATHIGKIVKRDIWDRADLRWEFDMHNDFAKHGVVPMREDITIFSVNTRATVEAFVRRASQVQKKIKAFDKEEKRRLGRYEAEGREDREEVYQDFRRRAFDEKKSTPVAKLKFAIKE